MTCLAGEGRHAGPPRASVLGLLCIVLLSACAAHPVKYSASDRSQLAVVENYLAALNRRDVLALTAHVDPAFQWFSAVDGERIEEVASREGLASMLTSYFRSNTSMQWRIESATAVDGKLAVEERTEWIEDGRMLSRHTLGVYELHDGRIRRVTYFLNER